MPTSICRLIFAVLVLLGVSARDAAAQPEAEARQRAERFADQVVRVQTRTADGTPGEAGFGILIGEQDGFVYIATPNHVAFGSTPASGLTDAPQVTFRASPWNQVDAERLPVASDRGIDDLAVIRVRWDRMPTGIPLVPAPMAHGDRLLAGTWAWNIGIDGQWDMPERAGGLGRLEPVQRWRRVGQLRTPPGASGGAVVTEGGIIGMVLQDGGDYSLALPIERIVELFQYWQLPTNLLADAASTPSRPESVATVPADAAPVAAPRRAGDRFRDCATCPELVVIPAGSFTMGSKDGPDGEEGRQVDEGPLHQVTVKSFAAGRYEVTRGEFAAFVQATGQDLGKGCWDWNGTKWEDSPERSWRDPGFPQGDRHPVACVSWHDAQRYVQWLSGQTGQWYRLLTEAEWEYAARAGTTTPFSTGSRITPEQAQYNWMRSYSVPSGTWKTAPVGSFPANAFGLQDMLGNVWEWVEDCYRDNYREAPRDGGAVTTCNSTDPRVRRGGSWFITQEGLRSAYRGQMTPDLRFSGVGFRVARTL